MVGMILSLGRLAVGSPMKAAMGGMAVALAVSGAMTAIHKGKAARLSDEVSRLEVQLLTARANMALLRAEMESDNEIDQIPDDGLAGAVDPRWLSGSGATAD